MTVRAKFIEGDDDELVERLRQLSLVDLNSLLAGTTGEDYADLLGAYADDLHNALASSRQRVRAIVDHAIRGPDPLALLDAKPELRAKEGGRLASARIEERLTERAAACRALAQLDDASGPLVALLLEADRRRASLNEPK